jgi:hypothetical protein
MWSVRAERFGSGGTARDLLVWIAVFKLVATAAVLGWEEKRSRSPKLVVSDMGVGSWFWTPMMSQRDVRRNPGAEDSAHLA